MFTDTPKKSIKISEQEITILQHLYKNSELIEGRRLIPIETNPAYLEAIGKLMVRGLVARWHIIEKDQLEMFWYLDPYNLLDL